MGLYFSALVVFAGTRRDGLGEPTRSRAISRTAWAAENVFFLGFLGMEERSGNSIPQRPWDKSCWQLSHSLSKVQ